MFKELIIQLFMYFFIKQNINTHFCFVNALILPSNHY